MTKPYKKLSSIIKTDGFNLLSEAGFVRIKVLYRTQQKVVGLVCSLIELLNLSEV